jgi:hypothetical protein
MSAIYPARAQLTNDRSCRLRDLFGKGWADFE